MNTFEFIGRILAVIIGLLACAIPRSSDAYCVRGDDVMLAWKDSFPDLVIPVYVAWGDENTVANTGHSPEDVARIAREVIARHNESVAVPKLWFAGFANGKWEPKNEKPHINLAGGITILSYRCEDLDKDTNQNLCGMFSDPSIHACGNMYRELNSPPTKGWVILAPAGCDTIPTPADKWTLSGNPDLAQSHAARGRPHSGSATHEPDPDRM